FLRRDVRADLLEPVAHSPRPPRVDDAGAGRLRGNDEVGLAAPLLLGDPAERLAAREARRRVVDADEVEAFLRNVVGDRRDLRGRQGGGEDRIDRWLAIERDDDLDALLDEDLGV